MFDLSIHWNHLEILLSEISRSFFDKGPCNGPMPYWYVLLWKCRHCRFTLESLNFNLHVWHYTMFVWGICVCWKNDTERSIRVVSLGRLLTEALAFVEKVTRNDLYVLSPSGGYLLLDNYRCVSFSVMTVLRSFFSLALFLHWVTSFLSQVERVFITHCARSTYLGIKTNRT